MAAERSVERKRRELERLRAAMRPGGLDGLLIAQRIDITFTSNALEGNTLTAGETALVVQKGITVAGKPLRDHLEAIDHAKALAWIEQIALDRSLPFTEGIIRDLHSLVVAQSDPGIAGRYADRARFVNTERGPHNFPAPIDIAPRMEAFGRWLAAVVPGPDTAFEAHRRLVDIHPFNDGNGRTARLLMNLILLRAGYPPIAVRPDDRPAYLAALERWQEADDHRDFDDLLYARLDRTLDLYIRAVREAGI